MAHLAGTLGQLRAQSRVAEQVAERVRSARPGCRPAAPTLRPRSTRACHRRCGRRRPECRACRPRRPPGPSPPSGTAARAPRPARRSRACAARRRGPRRPPCSPASRRVRRTRAACPPTSRCPTTWSRRSGNSCAQRERGVDGVLDLLVRHQPSDDGDHRGRATSPRRPGRARSVPLCTTATRGPRHAELAQLARGSPGTRRRTGSRRYSQGASVRSIHQPTLTGQAGVDDRPLLAVHVVDEDDDGRPGDQAARRTAGRSARRPRRPARPRSPRRRAAHARAVDRELGRRGGRTGSRRRISSGGAAAWAAQKMVTSQPAVDQARRRSSPGRARRRRPRGCGCRASSGRPRASRPAARGRSWRPR